MDVQKTSKAPLFHFFGGMRLTGDFEKIEKKFRKLFFPHAGTVEENT